MNQDIINSIIIQRKASDPRNNVYLSASAGTGKTKTLIDRILRLLLEAHLTHSPYKRVMIAT